MSWDGKPDGKTCPRQVSSSGYTYHRCGKPLKEDSTLCKQHAAGQARREANDKKRADAHLARELVKKNVNAKIARLEFFGIQATKDYDSIRFDYTGNVVVDPDVLIRILEGYQSQATKRGGW